MITVLKLVLLIASGLLALSGCASADGSPSTRVEHMTEPSPTPKQMTRSEIDERQAQSATMDNFLFYNSYATW